MSTPVSRLLAAEDHLRLAVAEIAGALRLHQGAGTVLHQHRLQDCEQSVQRTLAMIMALTDALRLPPR